MSRMLEALRQIESRTQPLPCPSPAQWPGQADFTPGGDHSESTPAMGDAMDLSQQMWQQVETALAAETPVLPLPLPADAADWPVPDAASRPAPPPSDAAPPAETAATTDPYRRNGRRSHGAVIAGRCDVAVHQCRPRRGKDRHRGPAGRGPGRARFRPGPGHRRQPSRAGAGGPPGGAIDHRPGGRPRRHNLVERRRPADGHARAERLARRNFAASSATPDGSALGRLLAELRNHYRLVLVDAASLLYAETAPLAASCDATYLVVRLGSTTRRAVAAAATAIRQCQGRLRGCDRGQLRTGRRRGSRNVYQPKRSTNSGASA